MVNAQILSRRNPAGILLVLKTLSLILHHSPVPQKTPSGIIRKGQGGGKGDLGVPFSPFISRCDST